MPSKKLSLVGASIVSTVAGLGSLAAGFISTVIIARTLGAEGTGLTAFAMWLVITASVISDRGTPRVVLRYILRQGEEPAPQSAFVRAIYQKNLWLFAVFAAGFIGYAIWAGVAGSSGGPAVWIVTAILFLVYFHSQLAHSADIGRADYTGPARRVALGSLLQVPATIAGALLFGPAGAMIGYLVRHLPQSLKIGRYLNRTPAEPDSLTPKMLKFGRDQWISSALAILVRTRIEFLFIGMFFSLTEVGYFAAGMTFASLVLQLALNMTMGLTPRFGSMRDQGALSDLKRRYRRALSWLSLILAPICFGGAGLASELIPFVFGSEFTPAVPVTIVLLIAAYPLSIVLISLCAMEAFEKTPTILKLNFAIAVMLFSLNLILTPFFGGLGAAWIKCLVAFATVTFALRYCYIVLHLPAGVSNLLWIGVSASASGLTAFAVSASLQGLPGLILGTAAGAVVYLLGIRLSRSLPFDDAASLSSSLRNMLPAPVTRPALLMLTFLRAPS